MVAQAGVRIPDAEVVRRGDEVSVALPVVVKPAAADNSAGVSLVRSDEELVLALEAAWRHGEVALVERFVELGREVRCGTVRRDGALIALPLEEYAVDAATKPIRDAADKLSRDPDGRLRLMAKDPSRAWIVASDDPAVAAVSAAARACHVVLGCGCPGHRPVRRCRQPGTHPTRHTRDSHGVNAWTSPPQRTARRSGNSAS